MSNLIFLQAHPLERCLPAKEGKVFERILKEANQSYVLEWKKTKGVKVDKLQYWNYEVICPKRNFADAYAHLGLLWGLHVLPVWLKRSKKHIKE